MGMILIGFIAYRATRNFDDYILGGRNLGSLVTALSAGASDMSGWLLMGLPGAVLLNGISSCWIAIGLVIGAYLNWLWVATRLRVFTELYNNALTLPDYFTSRFDDQKQLLRLVSAIFILIFFSVYCASGIVAGARLFQSTFNIAYVPALWLGATATILYTFIGGFLAISWTDTVQASLMLFALIITPIMVIVTLGGFQPALNEVKLNAPSHFQLLNGVNGVAIASFMAWGLGYFGQPHILARFMAADSAKSMKRARQIGMTWRVLCLAGAITVGFFGLAYFSKFPSNEVTHNSEQVFLKLTKVLFNPWLSGVLLSAILAAVMSTLSCQLLVSASAITEDLYKSFFRKNATQLELVWVGRAMVLLVSLIAIAIAYKPESRVLSLVSYAWAGFGAAFGPVILFSLYYREMSKLSALCGMSVGALTVLLWNPEVFYGFYSILPGFLFASLTILVVSQFSKKPDTDTLEKFDKALKAYAHDTSK
jgi:sodium/proline symporter